MKPPIKRSESRRSLQSSMSVLSQKKELAVLLFSNGFDCAQKLKLFAVSALPLLLLIGLCVQSTVRAMNDIRSLNELRKAVQSSQTAGQILSDLIDNRSRLCDCLISG